MATLYVKFTQVLNIDLSEIAQFVKAAIKTSRYRSLGINLLCGQWRITVKVSSEWRLNLGVGTQKRCPLPLNRGISSIKVTDTKTMWAFFRDQILCQLNGGVRWIEVSQKRGSEWHCYEIAKKFRKAKLTFQCKTWTTTMEALTAYTWTALFFLIILLKKGNDLITLSASKWFRRKGTID